ncbi:blast:Protein enabled [Drosophila guanche]|uniref:Blast:Protein enabled n=1 Tax=Drosophila guanche TaxID=7266 RepID=A0A3B0JH64_DROGU|nr:blast:Protein enabled [Drosophila guanche]
MAMKKLYAKTSFSSKKPNAVVASSGPILAYHQSSGPAGGMCEFQATKGVPVPAPGATTHPAAEVIRRSQSLHRIKGQGLSEYYSIEELQDLDLLDYRHPMYHHYQQQQQQQQQDMFMRQRSVYHEHDQLILQLPKVASGNAPIYEAPQQPHQRSVQDQTLYVQPSSGTVPAHTLASPCTSTSTSNSTSGSSASSSSSSSVILSTLRKCVSPSNPTTSNPPAAAAFCPTYSSSGATSSSSCISTSTSTSCSYPSKAGPSRLGCSMSFSIRRVPSSSSSSTQQQQQQQHHPYKQHLYSNIHHYLQQQQQKHNNMQHNIQQKLQNQNQQRILPQRRHNSVKDKSIGAMTTIFAYVFEPRLQSTELTTTY